VRGTQIVPYGYFDGVYQKLNLQQMETEKLIELTAHSKG
jgi:hypothetical protein